MKNSVKNKAINGMFWTSIERFGIQIVQFIINIAIARILLPSDYGIIGMLAIFMAVASSVLDCGFANALIQKKERNQIDYSTVFFFNIIVGLILYGVFYVTAPFIAAFYELPVLIDIIRIYSIVLIINSLSIVQTAKLTIQLNFKLQAIISILATIISGSAALLMAYNDFGVWTLVYQSLLFGILRFILIWLGSRWLPLFVFSISSFRQLFSFGSKLLVSGMINTIYQNIYTIVIGKAFNVADVGFFNRGNLFAELPSQTATTIITKVNYPILAEFQYDNKRLIHIYEKLLRTPMYLLFPTLFAMAVLANPMISVLLGEKWIPCAPILQVLCFCYIWHPLTHINLNLLYVKGRSDLVLKLEIIKKPIAFIILFASIPFGLIWMCVGKVLYSIIAFSLNCHYTGKIIDYGLNKQLKEIFPIIVYSTIMALCIHFGIKFTEQNIIKLCVGFIIGMVSYLLTGYLFKDKSLKEIVNIIRQ
jgi:O-antigen/teichoic acid export membrane protein